MLKLDLSVGEIHLGAEVFLFSLVIGGPLRIHTLMNGLEHFIALFKLVGQAAYERLLAHSERKGNGFALRVVIVNTNVHAWVLLCP